MSLLIKQGLKGACVTGLKPEVLIALQVAIGIYSKYNLDCVLTCGTEGKHSEGSLHYVGLAIDIGLPPSALQDAILQLLKSNLEDEFDVVRESSHYHIEFQPKKGLNA